MRDNAKPFSLTFLSPDESIGLNLIPFGATDSQHELRAPTLGNLICKKHYSKDNHQYFVEALDFRLNTTIEPPHTTSISINIKRPPMDSEICKKKEEELLTKLYDSLPEKLQNPNSKLKVVSNYVMDISGGLIYEKESSNFVTPTEMNRMFQNIISLQENICFQRTQIDFGNGENSNLIKTRQFRIRFTWSYHSIEMPKINENVAQQRIEELKQKNLKRAWEPGSSLFEKLNERNYENFQSPQDRYQDHLKRIRTRRER